MKLLIDDAHIEEIKRLYEYFPVDGVTTNPSILAKTGRNPYDVLTEIREFIGDDAELHVQVISCSAESILEEARVITQRLGKNTFVKIPTITEGLKAMKILSEKNYNITATAIYSIQQAYLAGKAGADYAAPYINRIENLGADGIPYAKRIQKIFKKSSMKTEVLAASFKNTLQVLELAEYGVGAVTAAPDVLDSLVNNPAVTAAIDTFIFDFAELCGSGKDMSNC